MEMFKIGLIFVLSALVLVVVAATFSGCQSFPPRYEVWRFDKHFRPYRVM